MRKLPTVYVAIGLLWLIVIIYFWIKYTSG
jgi:hypothetical protein